VQPSDETIPTPAVGEHVPRQVERIYRALVHLNFAEADPSTRQIVRYEAATGFLVQLGGRDFVFTAKHNVEGETPASTGVQIPRELTIPVRVGQGVSRFILAEGDVDVAVIELDPRERVLWQSALPFGVEDFGGLMQPRDGAVLCLCGFPVAERQARRGVPGMDMMFQFRAIMQLVDEIPGRRSTHEPPEGRGIHVRYGGTGYDYSLKAWREVSPPLGFSGGPLLALRDDSAHVLALARSIENGAEWCEPAVECARLLLRHVSPEVAADAAAIVRASER